jgi:hypothetical protein
MQLTQTLHGMDDRQRRLDDRVRKMDEKQKNMNDRVRNMDERQEEMGGSVSEMMGRVREVAQEQEEVRRYLSGKESEYSGLDNLHSNPGREETGTDQLDLCGSGKESHMNDNGRNEVSKVVSDTRRCTRTLVLKQIG